MKDMKQSDLHCKTQRARELTAPGTSGSGAEVRS